MRFRLLLLLLIPIPPPLAAQARGGPAASPEAVALAPRVVHANRHRAPAPRIDGRLDDAAWSEAVPASDFVQTTPAPGALATLPSSARVLFDDDAVYIGLRLLDPRPDSIVAPFLRRDDENNSDWVFVEVDTRFDRRSGFSFGLNPRGVQVDGTWDDDTNFDTGWNGVWQAAATIDSAGWSAEFRIPFSQLALAARGLGGPMTWGINFYRYTPHRGESSNWSPRLPSVSGIVSRFNQLQGLAVPPRHAAIEVLPYVATTKRDGERLGGNAGFDLRLKPTGTSTAGLSVKPDFGQVEADPSVVNLTAYETFQAEQRPMFVEGNEVFQFPSGLHFGSRGTAFDDERLFYSRRVGRAPQGSCPAGAEQCTLPGVADLVAAGRVSMRTVSGWSGGLFNAWTGEARAHTVEQGIPGERQVEPGTDFTVARLARQLAGGRAGFGFMGTFVSRAELKDGMDAVLAREALVTGADGRIRFGGDGYELTGFGMASRVHGETGEAGQLRVAKIVGRFQGSVAARVVGRGFESNDVGFQRNRDWQLVAGDWLYQVYRPGKFIRRWLVGSDQLGVGWTLAGVRRAARLNLYGNIELRNYWGATLSSTRELSVFDPDLLRGGPAVGLPHRDRLTLRVHSDSRRRWQATGALTGEWEPGSGSRNVGVSTSFDGFASDRLQLSFGPSLSRVREGWQYVTQTADLSGSTRYILGRLEQTTASLTSRATWAFSSRLTLQMYSQVFLSGGDFVGFREARDGRVVPIDPSRVRYDSFAREFEVDSAQPGQLRFADPDFSQRDLHLNLLVRWEFAPGSTLFLVWTHERASRDVTPFRLGRDFDLLRHAPGINALAAKVSYWIGF